MEFQTHAFPKDMRRVARLKGWPYKCRTLTRNRVLRALTHRGRVKRNRRRV